MITHAGAGTGHPPVLLSCIELHQHSAVWGTRGLGPKPANGLGAGDERNRPGAEWGQRCFSPGFSFTLFDHDTNLSVEDLSLSVFSPRWGQRAS